MSGSQQSPGSSQPQNSFPSHSLPDFTVLAEKLQETAQALLELGRATHVAANDPAGVENKPPEAALKQPASFYEIRSYRLPEFILQDEEELLKSAEDDDLVDVLDKAYNHLSCIVKLMQHYNEEKDFYGFELNNLADFLALPLDWLERLFATWRGFELVRHVKAE